MLKVDLTTEVRQMAVEYMNASNPVISYHSTEELLSENNKEDILILKNVEEFAKYITETSGAKHREIFYPPKEKKVFLATGEKFVPEKITQDNFIFFKLDDDGELIPTDNCYIQVYAFFANAAYVTLYTSSGIQDVSLLAYNISAGRPPGYRHPFKLGNDFHNRRKRGDANEIADRILNRTRKSVSDVRFFNLLMNPISKTYLNMYESGKRAYPQLRKDDLMALIRSKKVAKFIIEELGVLMPDFKKAIQDNLSESSLIKMFIDMNKQIAENKDESFDNRHKAMQSLINGFYGDEAPIILPDVTPILSKYRLGEPVEQFNPYGQGQLGMGAPKSPGLLPNGREPYDEKADERELEDEPNLNDTLEHSSLSEEDFSDEEIGVIPGYYDEDETSKKESKPKP